MKFLLDQNLSPRLVRALAATHPESAHVREFGMQAADDEAIWSFARQGGFTILSKDSDFHQRSFLYGAPPKVVWLRVGNCSTDQALDVLRRHSGRLAEFESDSDASFLVIE